MHTFPAYLFNQEDGIFKVVWYLVRRVFIRGKKYDFRRKKGLLMSFMIISLLKSEKISSLSLLCGKKLLEVTYSRQAPPTNRSKSKF